MANKQVFLIQSSGKKAEHITVSFPDRAYADEVTKYGYYRHEGWDAKKRDQDFGKVQIGDYFLHYCTHNVDKFPAQIKNIYEVIAIERIDKDIENALEEGRITKTDAEQLTKSPHILKLSLHKALNKGLELALIRKWVEEGKLSIAMKNCGGFGFNICKVDWKDYETIIEWDKKQPPEEGLELPSHNQIRDMISEIGRFEDWISEVEYPIDKMRLDVVWRRIKAGNPSYAFEVQVGGNFYEALTKLKHAWDKWNSKPFLVTTEKYELEAKHLLEGSFHEIEHVTKIVNWKKVRELYDFEKKAQTLKIDIGIR
jgi:hypothetical protein